MSSNVAANASAPARCPDLVVATEGEATRKRGHYSRRYLVTGLPGQCLLQRVSVHITYARGEHKLADYRQTYYEFFEFDGTGQSATDLHDFHYSRDGWRPAVLNKLFRHHTPGDPGVRDHNRNPLQTVAGDPVLTVTKRFLLGPGEVCATQPQEVTGGAKFGLLASGPDGPSRVCMKLTMPGHDPAHVSNLAATPRQFHVVGHGQFTQAHGWTTHEQMRFHYASFTTMTKGPTSYAEASLETRSPAATAESTP
tara:strand:+ start:292421 stop:293179 length:759 start_codon:yes stop_codon:yes gene_type:complete